MTFSQGAVFAIIIGMMAMFAWGRLRYDVVAALALLVSIVVGVVPFDKAFLGFSDDIVIIVATALIVSAAVAKSGLVDRAVTWLAPALTTAQSQVVVLVFVVTVLSAFVKNIGALALLIPVAFQVARKTDTAPSMLLMPMSFGALLGGSITLIGTSPNIIVSKVRTELMGQPFHMFDFAPVGLSVAIAGVAYLAFAYRLLPDGRKSGGSNEPAFNISDYTTEAMVAETSPFVGKTLGDLDAVETEAEITAVIRNGVQRRHPPQTLKLAAGDVLLLQGDPASLERYVVQAQLTLVRQDKDKVTAESEDDIGVVEAVVMPGSLLDNRTPTQVRLFERFDVNLIAVSRKGERVTTQLKSFRLREGDVIVVQGNVNQFADTLAELDCLPLAERRLGLGRPRRAFVPVVILAAAMAAAALGVVPVAIAFFAAAVLIILSGSLTLREVYASIEWPILVMLGALIPVSEAVRTTGGTDLIAAGLSLLAQGLPPIGALALILVAAMAVTPFLNNAATVLVMAPIAATLATRLNYNVEPFLMAAALGAASDFLTPFGHQCNTLVMGPGGYKMQDYVRLGLPLSAIVIVVGTAAIAMFWPMTK